MGVRRCLARSLTSLALMRTPKSANGPRSNSFQPDSPSRHPPAGDGRLRRRFSHTGHGPFRPLIVSNLKWGGPCRGHYTFPTGGCGIFQQFFNKGILKPYRISRTRKH